MGYPDIVLLDDFNLVIAQMHTMRGQRPMLEEPCFLHDLKGTFSIVLQATIHLIHGLRHMDMNFCPQLVRCGNHLFQIFRRASINCMWAKHDGNTSVCLSMEIFIKGNILRQLLFCIRRNTDQATGKNSPHARFLYDLRDLFHARTIHIDKSRCSGTEHFHSREHAAPVDIFTLHLRLYRPDFLIEPIHELHVIRVASEKRHRRMRMGIHQSWDCQHSRCINRLVKCVMLFFYCSDGFDLILFYHQIRLLHLIVRQEHCRIPDPYRHFIYSNPRYAFCSAVNSSIATPMDSSLSSAIFWLISSGIK